MREIPLTKGKVALVDDEDFEALNSYNWCFQGLYACRGESGKKVYMHRFIADAPTGLEVDHINHNLLDNRRENLRICTHQQNGFNQSMSKNNKSGYKGVCWISDRGKWDAKIMIDGKTAYLGRFAQAEEAARAYDAAALAHFGEFATLNFPKAPIA